MKRRGPKVFRIPLWMMSKMSNLVPSDHRTKLDIAPTANACVIRTCHGHAQNRPGGCGNFRAKCASKTNLNVTPHAPVRGGHDAGRQAEHAGAAEELHQGSGGGEYRIFYLSQEISCRRFQGCQKYFRYPLPFPYEIPLSKLNSVYSSPPESRCSTSAMWCSSRTTSRR